MFCCRVGKSTEINLAPDWNLLRFQRGVCSSSWGYQRTGCCQGKVARVAFHYQRQRGRTRTPTSPPDWLKTNSASVRRIWIHVIDLATRIKERQVHRSAFHIGSNTRYERLRGSLQPHQRIAENVCMPAASSWNASTWVAGLGTDYSHPNRQPIPDFRHYFETYAEHLKLRRFARFRTWDVPVGQCGGLITRALYEQWQQ